MSTTTTTTEPRYTPLAAQQAFYEREGRLLTADDLEIVDMRQENGEVWVSINDDESERFVYNRSSADVQALLPAEFAAMRLDRVEVVEDDGDTYDDYVAYVFVLAD